MVLKGSILKRCWFRALLVGSATFSVLVCTAQKGQERQDLAGEWPVSHANVDWTVDRGNPGGTQFAALAQIDAINVNKLRPIWEYHTGDASRGSTMYANPIVIDGTMYLTTASLKAVAVDAATGKEKWVFDPAKYNNGKVVHLRNRGVTYWKGAEGERIFDFVRDRVYAIDAKSGTLIRSFGTDGHIDLRENLGVDPKAVELEMTSPGAVYKNLLILGSRVGETYGASPGHIRAFDAVTGKLKWTFHTIPQKGELGYDTWNWPKGEIPPGGANAWGGITIDEKRGWVFAATGSATDDFYGAYRKGNDLFANCVLAIDANTGMLKWYYQTVHHDIWDYDNPPAPILVTVKSGGTSRDAVVQLTKMGRTFVLDRDSGKPIFPIEEVPVPPSDVPGEETSPTQPLPLKPTPLIRQAVTESDLTNISPEAHASALESFHKYRSGSIYTPPSLQGTITMPGHLGGSEWAGATFDPQLNVLYGNVNEVPTINRLRPVSNIAASGDAEAAQSKLSPAELGQQIYQARCMACHGSNRQGNPPQIPALAKLDLSQPEYKATIKGGRSGMPAFSQLSEVDLEALAAYVSHPPNDDPIGTPNASRYTLDGYKLFNDAQGFPGVSPPWGSLYAINLVTGNILWKVPLGEYPALAAKGIHNTGSMSYGGAVATSGGVVFIAATPDAKIRAFASHSGQQLWEYQLPAGGYATPSVYMVNGKEYVAISAGGGGKNATKSGDSIIAFALPEKQEVPASGSRNKGSSGSEWTLLFDGKTLNGWQQMNGAHNFTVEDGAIVGRTAEISEGINTFLCSVQEFDDFELELETYIDPVINSGVQIRTKVRPVEGTGRPFESAAGRVNGPQVEIRRYYKGLPTTGMLYGEAIGTDWLSSQKKIDEGHQYFVSDGWNKLRIVAKGPRIQTWVNGHLIEDYSNEELYKTHGKGFIGLQIHGLTERELSLPINAGRGITKSQSLMVKFRDIRIRPLSTQD
jgi:quinoprotein glucose dehydrogenase